MYNILYFKPKKTIYIGNVSQQAVLVFLLDSIYQTNLFNYLPDAIPHHFLNLQFQDDITLQDAIVHIRGTLVPYGYTPCPFKHDTAESLLELLRSIAATHDFPHTMKSCYEEFGADFSQHLYVLEVDPIKGITP